ncbi:MAG: ACP S-malonyltransferase [Planctomycetes bacterium]|nr:ACP S-malonyltransferase [Planctomycetota bacterium]
MSSLAFLFPGQGAQTVGMGRGLWSESSAARRIIERSNEVLGYDLARICFEGPAETLDSTVHSQPALYVTSFAALETLRETRPERVAQCDITAGLSLGEYTALAFAGVFSFEDGLRLVRTRGEAMQAASDANASGMVSVLGMERDALEQLCASSRQEGEVLQIANYLCPGNIAVSGSLPACERLAAAAPGAGAMKAIRLAVAGAFHTPLMQSAVKRLAAAVASVPMQPARIPVVSNVDGKPQRDPEAIRELLLRQVVSPVLWEDSLRWIVADGCREFCEIGSGRVLAGLLKRIDRKLAIENVTA